MSRFSWNQGPRAKRDIVKTLKMLCLRGFLATLACTIAAVQNACFVGIEDGTGFDDIFLTASEEVTDKSLTIVPSNRSKKFHFFYSKGEVKCLPIDFVFPHMTLCTLTSWFCGNSSAKTLPLKYLL
jgi:hypothetical protein